MLLVLFLLISRYSVVTTIGGCHSGRNKDHLTLVSCVSQGLTSVPDGIDPGTEVLVLSQNAFVSHSWAAYTTFTHLHELDLSQNLIGSIHHSGPVLDNLRVLRLSNNKLTGLGGDTFKFSPSLMEIYLDGNNISSIDEATFSDLPLLELINLSHNKLQVLPPHLLERISSSTLKNFDLEENCVQHLPDEFFASKPELPYVFLSNNSWVCTCQVSYLKLYLDDQGHNVYRHTGPSSIESVPESVVCSAPPTLKGRAILDLEEEEYCSSVNYSQPFITSTTHEMMSALKEFVGTIIQSEDITTILTTTTPTTVQPTTPTSLPKPAESSSTPVTTAITTKKPTTISPTTTKPTILINTTPTTIQPPTPTTIPKPAESSSTPVTTAITTKKPTTISPTTTKPTILINTTPTTIQPPTPTTIPKPAESSSTPVTTAITTNNPTRIRSVTMVTGPARGILSAHGGSQRSVPWCWWLFTTVLLLCIFSVISSCMLSLWLIITCITLYQPLKRLAHRSQGVTLRAYQVRAGQSLTVDRTEEQSVMFLPPEMIRETQPVFRSVLFISKGDEDCEADERREGTRNEDEEGVTDTVTKIDLLPAVTLHRERKTEIEGREEVFRKTLYRVISREEEIEGWQEVEEKFCGVMERDKGRREGGVKKEKTRYSLILREERECVLEGRKGETEWLVGEWELGGGGGGETGAALTRRKGECGLSDSTHMDTPEPVAEHQPEI